MFPTAAWQRPSRPSAPTCAASGAGRDRSSASRENRRAPLFGSRPARAGRGGPPSGARARVRRAPDPRGERAPIRPGGATACAVGMRALRAMGANVDYLVPNRFELGYGLSPELVELARARRPDLIITVDNGIASIEGVARAKALGIATLLPDPHLPAAELPDADCIVDPNQPGCAFPSKALAGVGVMFYVMLALRAELRRRGAFPGGEPHLAALTELVAPGTIADVVALDANNRNLA